MENSLASTTEQILLFFFFWKPSFLCSASHYRTIISTALSVLCDELSASADIWDQSPNEFLRNIVRKTDFFFWRRLNILLFMALGVCEAWSGVSIPKSATNHDVTKIYARDIPCPCTDIRWQKNPTRNMWHSFQALCQSQFPLYTLD